MVFFLIASLLLFSVIESVADRVFVEDETLAKDNLLTLSLGEIQWTSQAFSFVCFQMDRLQVAPEQVSPYLYFFVQECERAVLEKGVFPHDLSVDIFDVQFASAVEVSDSSSSSNFYSRLAVYLLQGAWRNSVKLEMESFLQLSVSVVDESLNPVFAHSEEIYLSSAILSALIDGPHNSLSDRLGVPANLLFSGSGKQKIATDNLFQEKIRLLSESMKQSQLQSQLEWKQREQNLRKFVIFLFVFPLLFSVNIFSVVMVFLAVRQRRYSR